MYPSIPRPANAPARVDSPPPFGRLSVGPLNIDLIRRADNRHTARGYRYDDDRHVVEFDRDFDRPTLAAALDLVASLLPAECLAPPAAPQGRQTAAAE